MQYVVAGGGEEDSMFFSDLIFYSESFFGKNR